MGMYQNQSCYIWEDEHPFTSYLGFTTKVFTHTHINSYITSMNSYQVISLMSLMSLKYHNHDVFGVENASGCHTRGEA